MPSKQAKPRTWKGKGRALPMLSITRTGRVSVGDITGNEVPASRTREHESSSRDERRPTTSMSSEPIEDSSQESMNPYESSCESPDLLPPSKRRRAPSFVKVSILVLKMHC